MDRIAIIRLSSLGDIVHALPAFQALRTRFPDAHITWIAEPAGAALLGNFPGIDQVLVLDLKSRPGLAARVLCLIRFIRLWRGQFDLLFDFQGLIKSALLAFLLGGVRLGFGRGNTRETPAALFYSRRASRFPEGVPKLLPVDRRGGHRPGPFSESEDGLAVRSQCRTAR